MKITADFYDCWGPILASNLFGSLFEPMNQFVCAQFVIGRIDQERGTFAFDHGELFSVQAQESQAGK
jgi:hypothetical protein